jgi:hypothetical protein
VVKEVTVTILWEETKLQPEELEDKCFLEDCEDNFDIIQPVPKEKKLYQSWLLCMVVVERGACVASLVLQAPLRLMTSRGSLPCGVSFRSHATQTSTSIWSGGRCSGAWKEHHWRIMESLSPLTSP